MEITILVLEAVVVYGLVLLAHSLRHRYSLAPLFALLGCFTAMMWWVHVEKLGVEVAGITFAVSSAVFFTSLLIGLFVVYVFDGPAAGRVTILAIASISVLLPFFGLVLKTQAGVAGLPMLVNLPVPEVHVFIVSILASVIDLVALAVLWEVLRRYAPGLPLFARVFAALVGTMWLDSLLFVTATWWPDAEYGSRLLGDVASRVVLGVVATPLVCTYLRWQRHTHGLEVPERPLFSILQSSARVERDLEKARMEIKHRSMMEKALRQSEERLRRVVEHMPVMVTAYDDDGTILLWNRECERVTGYLREEIVGNPHAMELLLPDPEYRAQILGEQRRRGNRYRGWEWRIRVKKGPARRISWSNISDRAPVPGWASWGVGVDLTKLRRSEAAAIESERVYRAMFEKNPAVKMLIDPATGEIIDANPAASRFYGHDLSRLRYMQITDLDTREREEVFRDVHRAQSGERPYFQCRHRIEGGEERTVEVFAGPIDLATGTVLYTIIRDITVEQQLNNEMVRQERLEAVGILAAGIAHDFNNLLTGMMGNLSLARAHLESNEVQDFARTIGVIEDSTQRAADLTHQLMTFTQTAVPVKTVVACPALIHEAVSFALRGSSVLLEIEAPDDLRPVEADEWLLGQVFSSLALNSRQAMDDHGRIRVTCENAVIWGATPLPLNPGRYVKIVLADEGPGIPVRMLPHVFDPFFSTKETGRGLGLTSCFSILRRHGGHIAAAAAPEGGARFTVYLPALDEAAPEPEEAVESPVAMAGHGRILVMDDEPVVRDVAGQMLRLLGYEPSFAEDGDAAVKRYGEARKEGRPFRAVIMDLTVPGGRGGREAIGDLLALDPEAVAVASSGYSEEPVMARCREHGFRGALPKPYSMEMLGRVLADLLPS